MDKVTFIEIETSEGLTEHAIIDHENGTFTSMPRAVYEAQVEHLTEIIPANEA